MDWKGKGMSPENQVKNLFIIVSEMWPYIYVAVVGTNRHRWL